MPIPDIDIGQIEDENMRRLVGSPLNIIKAMSADNRRMREERTITVILWTARLHPSLHHILVQSDNLVTERIQRRLDTAI